LKDERPGKNRENQENCENNPSKPVRLFEKRERIGKKKQRQARNDFIPQKDRFCRANLP
jgi:hypothetical protein